MVLGGGLGFRVSCCCQSLEIKSFDTSLCKVGSFDFHPIIYSCEIVLDIIQFFFSHMILLQGVVMPLWISLCIHKIGSLSSYVRLIVNMIMLPLPLSFAVQYE